MMSPLSIGNTFIYSLIPFGHYIYRIMSLKGSTDHMWTFFPLFGLFPFSLIPMFMMYFNVIKEGKVENIFEVFNYVIFIPIVWRIIGHLLMNQYFEGKLIGLIFIFFTIFLVVFCTNLFERYLKCKEIDSNKTLLTFIDTINLNLYMSIFSMMFIHSSPEKILYNLSPKSTIAGGIIWIIGYIYYQSIFNMANKNDPKTYCNPSITSNGNIIKFILWGIFGIFIFILRAYRNYEDWAYDYWD